MELSVILPTHNPHPGRLRRTLAALRAQTLAAGQWELLLVDNASTTPPNAMLTADELSGITLVREATLGLTHARRRGFAAASGMFAVLVDDDNVLAPDYLERTLDLFSRHAHVGVLGGRSLPEFESPPPPWTEEFHPLLALRDLGAAPLISRGLRPSPEAPNEYPPFAPIGAGMALRRAAWQAWVDAGPSFALPDRRGPELTSGGDNDIVLRAMRAGWEVAYFPELVLTHLIPRDRLAADYLARLNHGIQKSWMQVLALHDANPWPPLSPLGARLRMIKAWGKQHPWRSPAAHIRWRGTCGHFAGRVAPETPVS